MLRLLLRLSLLLLCLTAAQGWALSGPETAQQLNQRWAATPAQCIGGKPPYACSGVLALPMAADHPRPFWHHTSEAQARGSERFLLLRSDADPALSPGKVGYLLQDLFSATGQGKAYEVVDDGSAGPGEVLVRNWAPEQPGRVAIQALYYDPADPDALFRAQRGQLEYFNATGDWLPLIRLAAGPALTFGFALQEQLYHGYQVADRLNQRYARTATTCADGAGAYRCNGVLGRTTDVGAFHAWDPSPASIKGNGVSFMYFRADIKTGLYKAQGFVFRELDHPADYPLTLRCIFPYDGWTGGAADYCNFRPSCASLNITTVAAWKARYLNSPYQSCFFDASSGEFQLALDVRNQSGAQDQYAWSELIIAAWPTGIGRRLALEAFMHGSTAPGEAGARRFQQDYYQTDRRYIPIMAVRANAADGKVFNYLPEQQHID
ncbi:hypothetical protein [Pseudomonas sp. zfem002]|uniref:hypothetical protein n=1 Tax=Pseudomonas sp. zfem002 TaxID=3078197 RepID=UPI00292896AA|nr:hypothetical protein [Pseudomonas sp. zfem002]MDU9393501.1 hypothetical protein [Pseudomonas sp. zfem002]